MKKGQGKRTDTLQTDKVFTRKEYIERKALLRHLNDIWLTATPTDAMPDDDRQLSIARCMGLNDAMDAVKDAPAADAIEELQRQIDAWVEPERKALIKSLPKWIPVTERLPDGEVLALNAIKGSYGYHEYLLGYVGADSESDTGFRCENEYEILMDVTHWMPLPEPPKEET